MNKRITFEVICETEAEREEVFITSFTATEVLKAIEEKSEFVDGCSYFMHAQLNGELYVERDPAELRYQIKNASGELVASGELSSFPNATDQ